MKRAVSIIASAAYPFFRCPRIPRRWKIRRFTHDGQIEGDHWSSGFLRPYEETQGQMFVIRFSNSVIFVLPESMPFPSDSEKLERAAPPVGDGEYHKVEVKLKDPMKQRPTKVTRSGYYAPPLSSSSRRIKEEGASHNASPESEALSVRGTCARRITNVFATISAYEEGCTG